jgi:hypothetical protein
MTGNGNDIGWQTLQAASRRLKRSRGHLARLCMQRLRDQSDARWVTGSGKKGRWEIRTTATLKHRRSGADLESIQLSESAPGTPIQITIGQVTISIQIGNVPTVTTRGQRRREAVERPSKGVQPTIK